VYSGLRDVNFSVSDTDLPDILEILTKAQGKIESYWLSRISSKAVTAKS
jgi:hypothetical protein